MTAALVQRDSLPLSLLDGAVRRQNCSPGWSRAVQPQHSSLSPVREHRSPRQALAAQSLHEIRAGSRNPGSAAGDRHTLERRSSVTYWELQERRWGWGEVRNMLGVTTEPLGS